MAAVVGGSFSLFSSGLDFVAGAAGGVAVGLLVGWPVAEVRKRLDDPPVEITISLATAYAAYLPAEELGLSGVLAAVTAGIYLGWRAPEVSSVRMRMQGGRSGSCCSSCSTRRSSCWSACSCRWRPAR